MSASVWIAPRMALPFGEGISLPNPLTTCTTQSNKYMDVRLFYQRQGHMPMRKEHSQLTAKSLKVLQNKVQ